MKSDDMLSILSEIDDTLITRADTTPKKRKPPRTLGVLIAAIILCTAVSAATYPLWSPGIASYFGADQEAQEELIDQGITSFVDAPAATLDNGLTIQMQQLLWDGEMLTVSICYQAPEDGWLIEENLAMAAIHIIPSLRIGAAEFPCSTSGFEQTSVTAQTAYMICSFQGNFEQLDGETAVLTLAPASGEESVAPLMLSLPIAFSWKFNLAEATTRTAQGPFTAEYHGSAIMVEDVTITPVSIRFAVTESDELITAAYPMGVELRDGTIVSFISGYTGAPGASQEGESDEQKSAYYVFESTILDMDSISNIVFAAVSESSVNSSEPAIAFVLPLQ